jgi:NAD(P)H dehydrogenase (quinone)
MPYVLLRNGWYNENYSGAVGMGTAHGAVIGAAGDGKISSASRRDFAEAAAVVVTSEENQGGKVYELAGDAAFSMTELAEEISRQAGKPVAYADMPQAEYASALRSAGLPEPVAEMLADSDSGVAKGWLHDASRTLSGLIGRPTTPISATVAEALKA